MFITATTMNPTTLQAGNNDTEVEAQDSEGLFFVSNNIISSMNAHSHCILPATHSITLKQEAIDELTNVLRVNHVQFFSFLGKI